MTLEQELGNEMLGLYKTAKFNCKYNATRFFQMFTALGALQTAKKLINSNTPTNGFTAMWECGCLDLTIEKLVLNPKYRELFSDEELTKAKQRLTDYEYKFY
ncbi:MAG: hypothetical protein WCP97_09275 [bacterium]